MTSSELMAASSGPTEGLGMVENYTHRVATVTPPSMFFFCFTADLHNEKNHGLIYDIPKLYFNVQLNNLYSKIVNVELVYQYYNFIELFESLSMERVEITRGTRGNVNSRNCLENMACMNV